MVHITKYTFEVIWGAVAPNNSSCGYLHVVLKNIGWYSVVVVWGGSGKL